MSTVRSHTVHAESGLSLRVKLRLSETERGRLTSQLSAERNIHARNVPLIFFAGWLVGALVALVVLALMGALR